MTLTNQELIDEFKRRNLVDNKVLDRMLLDEKISQLREQVKKSEDEIAKLVAEKLQKG